VPFRRYRAWHRLRAAIREVAGGSSFTAAAHAAGFADQAHFTRVFSRTFGAPPALYAGDRGFHSPANVQALTAAGVRTVCLPQRGGAKTPDRAAVEHSPAFKRGQRFRAGIEGRISVLFRGRGMKRCRLEGRDRFEVFVGLAVLANNLLRIAELRKQPRIRRQRVA